MMYLLPRSTYSPDEHAFNADIVSSAGVFYILSIALTLSLVVAFALLYGAQNWVEGVTVTAAITIYHQYCRLFPARLSVVRSHRHSRSGFIFGDMKQRKLVQCMTSILDA